MFDICPESLSAVVFILLFSWCDNSFYIVPVGLSCSFLDKVFQLKVFLGLQRVTSLLFLLIISVLLSCQSFQLRSYPWVFVFGFSLLVGYMCGNAGLQGIPESYPHIIDIFSSCIMHGGNAVSQLCHIFPN